MHFLFILSVLLIAVNAATNSDFLLLKESLKQFIAQDPDTRIPQIIRMSFHDLANFDPSSKKGGPHGCILETPILDFIENAGLPTAVKDLHKFVTDKFPQIDFTFGDVISLAGKVAVEAAYPCIQINWRFGRTKCAATDEIPQFPGPGLNTFQELQPFLIRYGLTPNEMGVLIAGAHGIRKASVRISDTFWGDFIYATVSSGKDFIVKTLNVAWKHDKDGNFDNQYAATVSRNKLGRLPSDMIFFPRVVDKIGIDKSDRAMLSVQDHLESFVNQDESVFNNEFAVVYAKMLEIGVSTGSLTKFIEPSNDSCKSTPPTSSTTASTTILPPSPHTIPPQVTVPPMRPSSTVASSTATATSSTTFASETAVKSSTTASLATSASSISTASTAQPVTSQVNSSAPSKETASPTKRPEVINYSAATSSNYAFILIVTLLFINTL